MNSIRVDGRRKLNIAQVVNVSKSFDVLLDQAPAPQSPHPSSHSLPLHSPFLVLDLDLVLVLVLVLLLVLSQLHLVFDPSLALVA
eukprot:753677-Hanusia_phi.AAC.1